MIKSLLSAAILFCTVASTSSKKIIFTDDNLTNPLVMSEGFVDTSNWVGAEYQPSSSSNEDWLYHYESYEKSIDRELRLVKKVMGFTTLRVFLHSAVYEGLGKKKILSNIHSFLDIAHKHHIRIGFVFFDDCWNNKGLNLTAPCMPRKGLHNGCWMTSPQQVDRTAVERFQPYVQDIVTEFKKDGRVAWWEIFNEPHGDDTFSMSLRKSAYGWVKSLNPMAPVLSCWDENEATDLVDHHQYNVPWRGIRNGVFANTTERMIGGLVTEAGARWYQGEAADAGSPLTVIDWLTKLKANPKAPFVPGVMIDWEVMVSNSNTRWHWGTKQNDPEPVIPWHQHVFADGTPVSYTEAAAIKAYITGVKEWFYLETFLNMDSNPDSDEKFHSIAVGQSFVVDNKKQDKYLIEVSIRSSSGTADLVLQKSSCGSYIVRVNFDTLELSLLKFEQESKSTRTLSSFDIKKLDCSPALKSNWNILRVSFAHGNFNIWFNPMFIDIYPEKLPTPVDPVVKIIAMPPRISFTDEHALPAGDVEVLGSTVTDIDYLSILPHIIHGEGNDM